MTVDTERGMSHTDRQEWNSGESTGNRAEH
jgi:hypothetical protein